VSNSLKHAFPGNSSGSIDIKLCANECNEYTMIVKDSGAGFPDNVDFRNTTSLGLQLVTTLVSQIDGFIELKNSGGTMFTIHFKETIPN